MPHFTQSDNRRSKKATIIFVSIDSRSRKRRLYFPASMIQPRTIKVFVASPSDVVEERNALAKLIADINDVLAYLVPEKV
jgi:hypothetical protein